MEYLISRQYLRDIPLYFGIFSTSKFAKEMAYLKIHRDESANEKIVYRIYHDDELIFEHNKWGVRPVDQIIHHPSKLNYKICQMTSKDQFSIIAKLDNLSDAHDFITHRLSDDSSKNIDITYRLYHHQQMLSEHNQTTRNQTESQQQSEKRNAIVFNPSPLPTKPSPGPRSYLTQQDNDQDTDENKD